MRPKDYRYSESHEWVSVSGDTATIGITDFAVEHLSDLVFIELPRKGGSAVKGKAFGEIESVKAVSELFSPVTGEIVEVNDAVESALETLAKDPFRGGWLMKVRLKDKNELKSLKTSEEYDALVKAEEGR